MLAGSAPLSLLGVQIASSFSGATQANMARIVGGALIAGGLGFVMKTFLKGSTVDGNFELLRRDKILAVAIGMVGGFVVGLTSVGSGTWFGLAMLLAYPLSARRMVGTDMFHAALLLWVAGAGHLLHGNVDLHAIAWLLVGSIPGVLVGSQLSITVPDHGLRLAFGLVLVLSGIKLLKIPYGTMVVEVGVVVGGTALLLWVAWQLLRRYRERDDASRDDASVSAPALTD
jgi:uncharacterized membrane protein YfcA